MIKIDLITGFLGSGKTTFLIKYANHFIKKGEKICIIENDYGAINVDMMLIDSLACDREMISGACDYETHKRRFKTKLISIAMRKYDRVIVEPSGIYDINEYLDVMYDEPINSWYEMNNIFTIYDINTKNLSLSSKGILASEISSCGKIIVSKRSDKRLIDIDYINQILKENNSNRIINTNDILYDDDIILESIENVGYNIYESNKIASISYDSVYFLDTNISIDVLDEYANKLFNDSIYGSIIRIKGFVFENNNWKRINYTKDNRNIENVSNGQKALIIIGENLDKEKINKLLNVR